MSSWNKLKYLTMVVIMLSSAAAAAQDSIKVSIRTDLDSSYIYVNNELSGRGSAVVYLPPGKYVVKASEPSYYWNANSKADSLTLNETTGDTTVILRLNSVHYIESTPENAAVIAGDTVAGFTPMFLRRGLGEIILKKNGYADETIDTKKMTVNDNVKLKFTGKPEGESFFKTDAFKILVGSIVVLGGGTAYFKLKADNQFDQYQATGNKSDLDQTRKLDVVSGIFMGALQINFGVLIYYFLTD